MHAFALTVTAPHRVEVSDMSGAALFAYERESETVARLLTLPAGDSLPVNDDLEFDLLATCDDMHARYAARAEIGAANLADMFRVVTL